MAPEATLVEAVGSQYVVVTPPMPPSRPRSLDHLVRPPYERAPHPLVTTVAGRFRPGR